MEALFDYGRDALQQILDYLFGSDAFGFRPVVD
jgi:hypothetical protein